MYRSLLINAPIWGTLNISEVQLHISCTRNIIVKLATQKKKLPGTVLLEYKTKIITPESLPTIGTLWQTVIKTHQAPAWHGLRWYQQSTSEHAEMALKGDTVT